MWSSLMMQSSERGGGDEREVALEGGGVSYEWSGAYRRSVKVGWVE